VTDGTNWRRMSLRWSGGGVHTKSASKVYTLGFGCGEGGAVLQSSLRNSIYYHLQPTFDRI